MTDDKRPTFGIVGGGFTGTMLAVHLIEQSPVPVRILQFDRAAAFGSGVAYSTPNDRHLLNVRVGNMSAYDSRPDHFIKWLQGCVPESGADSRGPFVSRGLYGRYLRATLSSCLASHPASSMIGFDTEVVSLTAAANSVGLQTANGARHVVNCVALCVGNFPPALPVKPRMDEAGEAHYIANPWSGGLSRIREHDTVLLVGTGLTMVDVVLDLHSRGHRGRITAVSRRGFMPLPHRDVGLYQAFLKADDLPRTVTSLTRIVRREVVAAAASGIDWRAVLDSMRPQTQALWRGLPVDERRRFLRHVRPYWEVHRHRVAPPVAAEIEELRRTGQLSVMAGRLQSVELNAAGVSMWVKARGGNAVQWIEGKWLVNCSGPQLDYERIGDPLIRSLFDRGLARPDSLSLGLDLDEEYRLVGKDGLVSEVLFALGPPIRGNLWETTAVPDIRKQCEAVARHLTGRAAWKHGARGRTAMERVDEANPWKVLKEETGYDCRYFSVRHDRVTLSDGEPRSYHSVRMRYYGVCVVPVDRKGSVTLIGQYRYVLDRYSWEIPGGGARVGDDPLDAARAELEEETGCTAAHWLKIVEGAVSPGISTEAVPAFVAWGLDRGASQPDDTELLTRRQVPFADAVNMALKGEISNLPGIAALLGIEVRRQRGDLPDSLLALLK